MSLEVEKRAIGNNGIIRAVRVKLAGIKVVGVAYPAPPEVPASVITPKNRPSFLDVVDQESGRVDMRRTLILFAVLFSLSGCETMSKVDSGLYSAANSMAARDRVTGQRTVNLAGRAKQIEVADRNAGELLAKYDASGAKRDAALDPVAYARIQKIVTRVHAVSHMAEEKWTTVLIDDKQFNAFTMGGTYVFIFKGLMDQMRDDDEVAAVIGHEMAHVSANHAFERSANQQLSLLTGKKKQKTEGFAAAYTHENEREADRVGILYAALAGYDPYAAARVWERMHKSSGNQRVGYVDHPVNSERAAEARKIADQVKEYYAVGRQNPDHVALLENNSLWQKANKDVAGGKGGGVLAVLETALNTAATNQAARTQQLHQEALQRDLAALRTGMRIERIDRLGVNGLRVWYVYTGPSIRAKEVLLAMRVEEPGQEPKIVQAQRRGWVYGNTRFAVDFTDDGLQLSTLQSDWLKFIVDDIAR